MRGDKFRQARKQKLKELNFSPRRERLHEIIFEADTKLGKWFDEALLVMIIMSVLVVMLETVDSYNARYHDLFVFLEWVFTIFFTIEYVTRLYVVYSPRKYATSFYGIVDLLSILPTYISLFMVGTQSLVVIRALRLLRVFRIFKLGSYLKQGRVLADALKASKDKIIVFLFAVLILVCIFGSIMYLVEHNGNNEQFDNIPRSIYWAIVTLTTVGYGDISPSTPLGQFIAAIVMIMGYAVIAVPTGIVGSELMKAEETKDEDVSTQACKFCMEEGHDIEAIYCHQCGNLLNEHSPSNPSSG